MATDTTATVYGGWFGALCKHVPIFDARAPGDWQITHRSFRRTMWKHTPTGVVLECGKVRGDWRVTVYDYSAGRMYRTLPRDASRFKAFDAARQFLEGTDPLLVDTESEHGDDFEGLLTLENVVDAR